MYIYISTHIRLLPFNGKALKMSFFKHLCTSINVRKMVVEEIKAWVEWFCVEIMEEAGEHSAQVTFEGGGHKMYKIFCIF